MKRHHSNLRAGALTLFLLLLAPMCSSSTPQPPPASGEAIEAAVRNAEAELVRAGGDDDV